MSKTKPDLELPIINNIPLPYAPIYRKKETTKGLMLILPLFFLSVIALTLIPSNQNGLFLAAIVTSIISVVLLFTVTKKALTSRGQTANFLLSQSEEFIEAASRRYEVKLTETILWNMAQGGNARILSSSGELVQIKMMSDPVTRATTLTPVL